jgi:toxin-antitoxin system PIN domain toxin
MVPDANVLLYAVDATSARHEPARAWLEDRLSGSESFGLVWSVLLAFLRISTRAGLFETPLTADQAFDLVTGWLDQPSVVVLHPGDRHHLIMRELLAPLGTAGNLVPDAHLAAIAIEHGATVASSDSDFGRFARLAWVDPISGLA